MITQSLDLSASTIVKLFEEGQCLTFNPQESFDYRNIIEKESRYKKEHQLSDIWTTSKIAKLAFDSFNPPFHYFSNGVVIHAFNPEQDNSLNLKRIEKVLYMRGYKIQKVYGPQTQFDMITYSYFLRKISKHALKTYSLDTNMVFEPIPDKRAFVKKCFGNGNILLTASKYENIPETYRKCLALFENGDFFISNRYKTGNLIFDPALPTDFKLANNKYIYLQRRFVPQNYIDALYQKATDYDWYGSGTNIRTADSGKSEEPDTSFYIENLLKQRSCISILDNPKQISRKPNHDLYVLFNDGKLLLSKNQTSYFN